MAILGKCSPWVEYYREVQALFAEDEEIHVVLDEENYELSLYVETPQKATALMYLLPPEKVYGNVTLKVKIIPANAGAYSHKLCDDIGSLFAFAFERNPALSFVHSSTAPGGMECVYVVFTKEVVQFYTDELTDYYGVTSTLYQNIAKDVFREKLNVFYCTQV